MSNHLYPLLFSPILKSTIWGGTKLQSVLDKPIGALDRCGESWEISGVEDNISTVTNGSLAGKALTTLIEEHKGSLLGTHVYEKFGNQFPLLVKFIDANQDLSIQVHPNDVLAKERHNSFGKTEMWYVVDAEAGSTLISGFNKETNPDEYLEYFNSGRLTELLNEELVTPDDVYFLPAGRVHTIGKGLLIAEIQQTSDITYRIYDFERVDKGGNQRELHVREALDAIDYNYYSDIKTVYNKSAEEAEIANCEYFITNRIFSKQPIARNYENLDSFVILMVLSGSGKIITEDGSYTFNPGNTYLIPANVKGAKIEAHSHYKMLEVYIP